MIMKLLMIFAFFIFPFSIIGQTSITLANDGNYYATNANIAIADLFVTHKTDFGLGIYDMLTIKRGLIHNEHSSSFKFQQKHKGIPIEGAIVHVMVKDDNVVRVKGKIVRGMDINTIPTLTPENAITISMNAVPAEKYAWEDPKEESLLKEIRKDKNATYYPVPQLVIAPVHLRSTIIPENMRLAYKVDVFAKEPPARYNVFLDANTGEIMYKLSLIKNTAVDGTVTTLYNGTKNIKATYNGGYYTLEDDTRGIGQETSGSSEPVAIITKRNFTSPLPPYQWYALYGYTDDTWDGYESSYENNEKAEGAIHWAGEMTLDYYTQYLNRNGLDNDLEWYEPNPIVLCVGFDVGNAHWLGTYATFGESYSVSGFSNWFASLDVVGHEITHGVNDWEANLAYDGESGALDESFADIFGTMVEWYGEGSADYTLLEDFCDPNKLVKYYDYYGKIRDMSDPHSCETPDTYGSNDPYWTNPDTTWDHGGVHINNGVQSHWFYLLAEGGSGTNENGAAYSVSGIGKIKAAEVAYINLTEELETISQYADARVGAIQAAEDIYNGFYSASGNFSSTTANNVIQVIKAWHAVGVGGLDETVNGITFNYNDDCFAGTNLNTQNSINIESGITVGFHAGSSITLGPGFWSKNGSTFRAEIPSDGGSKTFIGHSLDSLKKSTSAYDNSIFVLNQNYPNPFNPSTTISFVIPAGIESSAKYQTMIDIYDANGKLINKLFNNSLSSGSHSVVWDGKNEAGHSVAGGVYILKFRSGNFTAQRKIVFMK